MKGMVYKVEEYKVCITPQTLYKLGGEVRVWDTPRCLADGGKLIDVITEPVEAFTTEEQPEIFGTGLQRVKIKYGNYKEGWVLHEAVERV